ncbi:MAG: hypothetical protein OXU88_07970 [Gammaproteobacteria bacterium]|nr:hypothetical protein [Gammaproteobacteria bacterium]
MSKPKSSTPSNQRHLATAESKLGAKTQKPSSECASTVGKRSTPKPIESVEDLLRAFYAGKFKRSTLNKKESDRMRVAEKLNEAKCMAILNEAISDRTLGKTRELMLFCVGLRETNVIQQIDKFCDLVIHRHPAFGNGPLSLTESSEVEAARKIMNSDFSALSWPNEIKSLTKKEQEQCKINAVHCLLLWFRRERKLPFEQIRRILQLSLWETVPQKHGGEKDELRALLSTKDSSAVPVICVMLEKSVEEAREFASNALQQKEKMHAHSQKLSKDLTKIRSNLRELKSTASRLEKDLANEKRSRADDVVHLKDDREQLRGRVLRCLNREISLLDEGLRALKRESPRVHVMIDHAERAIDGLKREIEHLRER